LPSRSIRTRALQTKPIITNTTHELHKRRTANPAPNLNSKVVKTPQGIIQYIPDKKLVVNKDTKRIYKSILESLWEYNGIEKYYCDIFIRALDKLSLVQSVKEMHREINLFNYQRSILYRLNRSIVERENAMKHVKLFNTSLKTRKLTIQTVVSLTQILKRLQTATLSVIENGLTFRTEIKRISQDNKPNNIPIMHNGVNYFKKILNDNKAIQTSKIGELLNIRDLDLFFLNISSIFKADQIFDQILSKGDNPVLILSIPRDPLYKRMKRTEFIVNEELKDIQKDKLDVCKLSKTLNNFTTEDNKQSVIQNSTTEKKLDAVYDIGIVNIPLRKPATVIEAINPSNESCYMSIEISRRETVPVKSTALYSEELKPLELKESEAEQFLKTYIEKLPEDIQNSYSDPSSTLARVLKSLSNSWLVHGDVLKPSALAVLCIETALREPRVVILHASTLKFEDLPLFIAQLKEYIWTHIDINEIRVEIKYIYSKGKLMVNEELKEAYCKSNGFKWKTVLSDPNKDNERTLILGLSKPKEHSSTISNIRLQHCSLLRFTIPDNSVIEDIEAIEYESSMYAVCTLLKSISKASVGEDLLEVENANNYIKTLIRALKSAKEEIEFIGTEGLFSLNNFSSIKSFIEKRKLVCDEEEVKEASVS